MAEQRERQGDKGEIREQAQRMGKILAERLLGKAGPGLDMSLADMEDLFDQFISGFAGGMYQQAAETQASHIPEIAECPNCGCDCRRQTPKEDRTLQTMHGSFSWQEPQYVCVRCERLFFPSATRAAD